MIDLKRAVNVFENYVNNFDMDEENIKLKKDHTFRVMQNSIEMAKSLNLNEEDTNLAVLIGLLHDISRFEQWKQYKTFQDLKSMDHGNFGVKILFEDGLIRSFIETDEYDDIIKYAIEEHNKVLIGQHDERTELFCKIIRDADKLDVFDIYMQRADNFSIDTDTISDSVYDAFIMHRPIDFKELNTDVDRRLLGIAMIFDLNFDYSKEYINKKGYINNLLDIIYKKSNSEKTKEKLLKIKSICESYMRKEETYVR